MVYDCGQQRAFNGISRKRFPYEQANESERATTVHPRHSKVIASQCLMTGWIKGRDSVSQLQRNYKWFSTGSQTRSLYLVKQVLTDAHARTQTESQCHMSIDIRSQLIMRATRTHLVLYSTLPVTVNTERPSISFYSNNRMN